MDGVFMKFHTRVLLSLLAGLLALYCYATPMWWGALFPSITRRFSQPEITAVDDGYMLESDTVSIRFRSLELLRAFLEKK